MKTFNVPTFESRVAKVTSIEQLDEEMRKAKAYAMTIRKHLKEAKSEDDRAVMNDVLNKAERVLRQLRSKYFEIEEEIIAKESKEPQLTSRAN